MPAPLLHQLGDEPIYCEAVHDSDDDVYSGSEDDYYEGPLHRRLHIEKKAIDFLAGHVPVLLSARLRGPFDHQHWNNPWRSRRAARHVVNPSTQTTRSNPPVEGGRGHGPGRVAEEDFPNTQGTSLYPLPSPEITNPPSARKNPYMEEAEYNRVKTWRETVKGTSVSRDPFWSSNKDDPDDVSVTRKRSADERWLHQRASKKRKHTDLRTSPPEESPSQAAAKTRKDQTRRPYQRVALSIQTSSKHEDELVTGVNTRSSICSTRIANRTTGTPRSRRIERRPPYPKLRRQEAETSEDELSMPSTTPTHKAARPYTENCKTPMGNGSPSRRTTATQGASQSRSNHEQVNQGRTQVEKIQASQLSVRQRSSIASARKLSKDAARMVVEASGAMGKSPGHEVVKRPKSVRAKKAMTDSAMVEPKAYAKVLAEPALSQQDNSFCFHTRAKSPVEESGPPPKDPMDGTTPIISSTQLRISTTAVEPIDGEHHAAHEKNGDMASADVMELGTNAKQQSSCDPIRESEKPGIVQLPKHIQPADAVLVNDECTRKEQNDKTDDLQIEDVLQANDELEAMVDVDAASEPGSAREIKRNSESIATETIQVTAQTEYRGPSDPEWSTYLSSQDLPSTSAVTRAATEEAQGIPLVEQVVDDPSDPEWSTYVDTQEFSTNILKAAVGQKDASSIHIAVYQGPDGHKDRGMTTYVNTQDALETEDTLEEDGDIPVINQGLDGSSDSDWVSFRDTQDQSAAAEPQLEDTQSHCEEAMDANITELANRMSIVEDDDGSNSQWSTYRSEASKVDADQTDQTEHESVQIAVPPDLYAEVERQTEVSGSGEDSNASKESHQDMIMLMPGSDAIDTISGQEQGETAMAPLCKTPMEIDNAKDGRIEGFSSEPGSFDETTTSIELRNIADAGILDEGASSIGPQQVQSQHSMDLQLPQTVENGVTTTPDSGFLEQTTASLEPTYLQSTEAREADTGLQVPHSPGKTSPSSDSGIVDVTTTSTEPPHTQSPWMKEVGTGSQKPAAEAARKFDTNPGRNTSTLRPLAGQILPSSQLPQSPWFTPTHSSLPTPDFTMSIRAFSNFETPSPTKKRASSNGSILRDRFKTPVFQKPERRVHFATLPGEEEADNIEGDLQGNNTIFIEDDVSYFDPGGHKTGTIRLPRPAARAASPPPLDVSSAEVGSLLDHDSRFAKHFEAMAKRKNAPRKTLKLLPSDSQQASTASQGVGAMAEAFIQASQTRRRALMMAEADAAKVEAAGDSFDKPTETTSSPIDINQMEEQENIEPVDDVSAVLNNLGEFLDDTWGVGLAAGGEGAEETRTQAQSQTSQGKQGARGMFDMVGDPMLAFNINVWAD